MTAAILPRMTAETARRFDGYSTANAALVSQALTLRARPGCACKPYEDVYTFGRWKAQGYNVQKGEKSVKIGVYVTRGKTDEQDGEESTRTYRIPWTAHVFCRCQVAPSKAAKK